MASTTACSSSASNGSSRSVAFGSTRFFSCGSCRGRSSRYAIRAGAPDKGSMYLDLSLKKVVVVIVALVILFTAVAYTLAAKTNYFGTTPFGYSAFLGLRYAIDTVFYSVESIVPRMYAAALGRAEPSGRTSSPA